MNGSFTLLIALLLASQSMACVADELVEYPPVPGRAASSHYKVRVCSASDGDGINPFGNTLNEDCFLRTQDD